MAASLLSKHLLNLNLCFSGFQECVIDRLILIGDAVADILDRLPAPTSDLTTLAGAPNCPLGTIEDFQLFDTFCQADDNLQQLVSLFIFVYNNIGNWHINCN